MLASLLKLSRASRDGTSVRRRRHETANQPVGRAWGGARPRPRRTRRRHCARHATSGRGARRSTERVVHPPLEETFHGQGRFSVAERVLFRVSREKEVSWTWQRTNCPWRWIAGGQAAWVGSPTRLGQLVQEQFDALGPSWLERVPAGTGSTRRKGKWWFEEKGRAIPSDRPLRPLCAERFPQSHRTKGGLRSRRCDHRAPALPAGCAVNKNRLPPVGRCRWC